ncbi:hypothetical protein BJ508DRAFT_320289 [Ascobolus immersus RN42]|uniref:BZIP domain-containing protein n=1 Tax=Ascobolus immersus RN42 TaxID=1160509 RepID=A0A3N4IQH6_ASCIM|nr:hypothetical protein BJ508DRAFT_320289 [Ascobolus immersus RN42]
MAAVKDSPPPAAAASPTGSTPEFVEQFPPQKRKGGRKPVYATQEERKQRNRAAQAAFRERRTEYMKKLETTIKENEETLSNLSNTARLAQETVLMLRYKNSLLERILLEKGIDVKAELEAFGNTYDTPVTSAPTSMGGPLSINGHTAPILGQPMFKTPDNNPFKVSPSLAPASLSHSSSPTASSAVPTPPDNSQMSYSPRPNILSNDYSSPHPGSFMTSGFSNGFRNSLGGDDLGKYPLVAFGYDPFPVELCILG